MWPPWCPWLTIRGFSCCHALLGDDWERWQRSSLSSVRHSPLEVGPCSPPLRTQRLEEQAAKEFLTFQDQCYQVSALDPQAAGFSHAEMSSVPNPKLLRRPLNSVSRLHLSPPLVTRLQAQHPSPHHPCVLLLSLAQGFQPHSGGLWPWSYPRYRWSSLPCLTPDFSFVRFIDPCPTLRPSPVLSLSPGLPGLNKSAVKYMFVNITFHSKLSSYLGFHTTRLTTLKSKIKKQPKNVKS